MKDERSRKVAPDQKNETNMTTTKPIQEWKSYSSHNGGVNNLAVCRLNHTGDGAAAVAVGTSLKNMNSAVKNAYRNLRRKCQHIRPSLPKLPRGWSLDQFNVINDERDRVFTRAIDTNGCRWYNVDGVWKLNVPWFRRSSGLASDKSDDIAVVDTVFGHNEYPITEKGTIKIGARRIGPHKWNH